MSKQLTIRGVSEDLAGRLDELSRTRGQSVNAVVLDLLEKSVGIAARKERLARFATWTDEDLAEFEDSLRAQRTIDERIWP